MLSYIFKLDNSIYTDKQRRLNIKIHPPRRPNPYHAGTGQGEPLAGLSALSRSFVLYMLSE